MYLKPSSLGKDKLDSRWEIGHCLGIQDESAELIVGTSIGVLKVRSVRSCTSIADQWKSMSLFEIAGVPWRPIPGRDGVELKSHVRMASEFGDKMEHAEGQQQPFVARAVEFLKEDIKKYGMSPGCAGCTAANRGTPAVNHSDSCRIRIEKLMSEDRRPIYMRAMDRLAEAALRKEAQEETTATTTAAAAAATTTATKRSADAVPEGERTAKVPTPAEVRGEIRSREEQSDAPEKRLKRNEVGMLSTVDAEEHCSGSLIMISPTTISDPMQAKE